MWVLGSSNTKCRKTSINITGVKVRFCFPQQVGRGMPLFLLSSFFFLPSLSYPSPFPTKLRLPFFLPDKYTYSLLASLLAHFRRPHRAMMSEKPSTQSPHVPDMPTML
jgi:hypothetical protein